MAHIENMGNWRSRWERKRDLAKGNKGQDQITKIKTRATDKDYIVTEVLGYTPNNLYFRIVPDPTKPVRLKKQGRSKTLVEPKKLKQCKGNCNNFVRTHRVSMKSIQHSSKKSKTERKKK